MRKLHSFLKAPKLVWKNFYTGAFTTLSDLQIQSVSVFVLVLLSISSMNATPARLLHEVPNNKDINLIEGSLGKRSSNLDLPHFASDETIKKETSVVNNEEAIKIVVEILEELIKWFASRIKAANEEQRMMNELRGDISREIVKKAKEEGKLELVIRNKSVREHLLFNLLKTNEERSENESHRDAAIEIYNCLSGAEIYEMENQKVKIKPLEDILPAKDYNKKIGDYTLAVIDRKNKRDSDKTWGKWMTKKMTAAQFLKYNCLIRRKFSLPSCH